MAFIRPFDGYKALYYITVSGLRCETPMTRVRPFPLLFPRHLQLAGPKEKPDRSLSSFIGTKAENKKRMWQSGK
jgi:hypothetical protein